MGWESRSGTGRRCYTRSRRVEGRVVREYLGSGFVAEAAALLEAIRRGEMAQERAREREEQARQDALEREMSGFCDQVEAILRETLKAAGYHQHARGAWRKRRTEGSAADHAGDSDRE